MAAKKKSNPPRKQDVPRFDILQRIFDERQKRGWSDYALATSSGVAQSTISMWFSKHMQPSVASIEKICDGLGITLSQFFYEGEIENSMTAEQQRIFALWSKLSKRQRGALAELIESMIAETYPLT